MKDKKVLDETYWGIVYTDGSFKSPEGEVYTRDQMFEAMNAWPNNERVKNELKFGISFFYYDDVMQGKANRWHKTLLRR